MPTNFLIDKWGLRKSFIFMAIFGIIGGWIKCLLNYNFWWASIGTAVVGIGRNIVSTTPPIIALKWFRPKNTALISALLSFFTSIGTLFGMGISILLLNLTYNPEEVETDKIEVRNMLFKQAIIGTVVLSANIIAFKSKPPTPPSETSVSKRKNYLDSFKGLCKNPDYKYCALFVASFGGFTNYVTVNIDSLVVLFDLPSSIILPVIALALVGATLFSGFLGYYVIRMKAKKKFKKLLIILNILLIISWIVFNLILNYIPSVILISITVILVISFYGPVFTLG